MRNKPGHLQLHELMLKQAGNTMLKMENIECTLKAVNYFSKQIFEDILKISNKYTNDFLQFQKNATQINYTL